MHYILAPVATKINCKYNICDCRSNFVTSESVLYNFCWERSTKSEFAALVDETSFYHC